MTAIVSKRKKNDKVQILRTVAIVDVVLIHTCPSEMAKVFARPFINYLFL